MMMPWRVRDQHIASLLLPAFERTFYSGLAEERVLWATVHYTKILLWAEAAAALKTIKICSSHLPFQLCAWRS
jgi:hypothetical protein